MKKEVVYYNVNPKEDITAYELAKIVCCFTGIRVLEEKIHLLPKCALRHIEINGVRQEGEPKQEEKGSTGVLGKIAGYFKR